MERAAYRSWNTSSGPDGSTKIDIAESFLQLKKTLDGRQPVWTSFPWSLVATGGTSFDVSDHPFACEMWTCCRETITTIASIKVMHV